MEQVVVVRDRHMVADEELGAMMMGSFLRKLCHEPNKPDAIVFYGTGVHLLTEGSQVMDALEVLAGQEVDLIGCGTCVGFYGVRDRIQIGRISDMKEIISVLMRAASVVTL